MLLLSGAVLAAGWALVATDWTDGLDLVLWAGLGGVVAGLLLGWSVFPSLASHLASAIYGLAWVGFLLCRRLPEGLTAGERIRQLVVHLVYWFQQAVTGGEGRDTLIFVMLLGGLFWILGYNAAWNTYRRLRVWRAIIPLGVITLVGVYYYVGPAQLTVYLALYLFFALLYLARSHVIEREQVWRQHQVSYSPDLRFSALQAGLAATLVALALAWGLPSASAVPRVAATWRRLSKPWRTVQDEWQRLFSTLRGSPVMGVLEPFGPSMPIGGPRELPEILLMDVAAPREGRYYWRGAVYTRYAGDRWDALETESILLIPGREPPGIEQTALRRAVLQTITSYAPGRHMLVGASQWARVDREAEAYINLSGDAPLEFMRVASIMPLQAGAQYTVLSYVSDADATSLRQASTDYPEWVRERYLQLPSTLPDQVRLLAEHITAGASTPYDKALSLEQYLRQNIDYDLNAPDVPEGRDYVEYLLFDSRRGYCNHYASAMAVLARSVGLPTRVVAGYSQGEYDPERNVFRVRGTNAHTWPEIYFPEYGWIEFEPTVSEEPYVRPELEEALAEEELPRGAGQDMSEMEEEFDPAEFARGSDWQITSLEAKRKLLVWPWIAGLALVTAVGSGWWVMENVGFHGLLPAERAYARLLRLGHWLGRPLRAADTPSEWADDVSRMAPEAREPIEGVIDLFLRARFARADIAAPVAKAAWQRARSALCLGWLHNIFPLHRGRGT